MADDDAGPLTTAEREALQGRGGPLEGVVYAEAADQVDVFRHRGSVCVSFRYQDMALMLMVSPDDARAMGEALRDAALCAEGGVGGLVS